MREKIGFLMKKALFVVFLLTAVLLNSAIAEDSVHIDDITVVGKKESPPVKIEPQKTIIDLETYKSVTIPQNVGDILKDLVIMDYRGQSDLVPESDTMFMRGFSSKRFVTATDSAIIRKSGGRGGDNNIDYALLPPFLIDSIEVLPGPHSALYPGESIGGVVNFKTRAPKRYETLKPDISVSTSYGSYNTQNHNLSLRGGCGNFTYDMGYQRYLTDGYLRNNKADIDNIFGRVGYLLSNNGYIALTASYTHADREKPACNDPYDPESDYDGHYPEVSADVSSFYPWQSLETEKKAPYYQLNFNLPTSLGTWRANAYFREEERDRSILQWANKKDHSKGIKDGSYDVWWRQQGGRVTNEFRPASNHVTTIGGELFQAYDKDDPGHVGKPRIMNKHYKKRNENISGFIQDKWTILPQLSLTAGLRYEDNTINASNYNPKTDKFYTNDHRKWIKQTWCQWIPKSFLTYKLDNLADGLRDTSVSLGVSRIWRVPGNMPEYNSSGIPHAAWLEPEHGTGYDMVFSRRLTRDIHMQLNYSYYQIKDYIAFNRAFNDSIEERIINLDEVIRQGVEFQFAGSLTDSVAFRVGYAWQDFENKGDELAGKTELDNRAENRVSAGLTWNPMKGTTLILNYEYQDEQVVITSDEIAPDVYEFHEIALDSYHVVDFAVEQTLDKWLNLKNCVLKIYVKNLFDKEYQNTNGYPAVDCTVGAGIRFSL